MNFFSFYCSSDSLALSASNVGMSGAQNACTRHQMIISAFRPYWSSLFWLQVLRDKVTSRVLTLLMSLLALSAISLQNTTWTEIWHLATHIQAQVDVVKYLCPHENITGLLGHIAFPLCTWMHIVHNTRNDTFIYIAAITLFIREAITTEMK